MKKRNGFVSNSSSSSFVIYGIILNDNLIDDFSKQRNLDFEIFMDEYLEKNNDRVEFFYSGSDNDPIFLGAEWRRIRDDETGKQFKESITEKIRSLFPNIPDGNFNTFDEIIYC
ncbi:MAG: hypothetical protein ABSG15_02260 [FCB group bacterium]|jgi:hypothetical protein